MGLALLSIAIVVMGAAPVGATPVPDVQKRLRAVEAAILRGQADTMRIELQEQARNRPNDVMLRVFIAWCGMPSDESWNALKGIVSVNPENAWAWLGMGRIYGRWKMRDQAEQSYRSALKVSPRFYPALTGLGDLARAAGRLDDAEHQYRDALALEDDAEAHAGLGLVLSAGARTDEANKELKRALELWPDQPEVLGALSRLAKAGNDVVSAERYAAQLAELTPKDRAARRLLADLRFELGQKDRAAPEYERVLRLGGADGEVLSRLASIYRELGNAEGEEHALQQLAALDKQSADAPIRLAELAEARGALDEAEGQLMDATQRVRRRPDLLQKLARVQVKRREIKEARESYLAAAAAPGDKPADLDGELEVLTSQLKLPKKPAKGTVDQIYWTVSNTLNALYTDRLHAQPSLAGVLRLRAKVDDDGHATEVDVAEDSVGDPIIAGHVYFALKDAQFPKHKREPLFEFELKPPQKK
jgi:tetratricopeptide (TPR) repeat protein